MTVLGATLGPSAYWYLTRATGAVALVLLTASVILGILGPLRFKAPRWPRFALDTLHRDVSLLVIVLLVLHIVTTVLDGFAPITLVDGVIPFVSPYRPLWLGLGTLSFDLLLAIVVSSLVRRRLGYRSWRAIHWLAYGSWPVAILHGIGTGSDVKQWWMLLLTILCVVAVLAAVLARVSAVDRAHGALRTGAFAASMITPLAIATFTLQGPLQHGWSHRAGTPARLLGASQAAAIGAAEAHGRARATPNHVSRSLDRPFSAKLLGTASQSQEPGGAIVQLQLSLSGGLRGELRVRIGGEPLSTGGLSLTGSQVDLSAVGAGQVFAGRIVSLAGDHFLARVTNSAGTVLNLTANLTINQGTNAVSGTLSGSPIGGGR